MLHDIDRTLATFIQREFPIQGVDVSFAAPDSEFPPSDVTLPAIDFFLYEVRENLELHSNDRDVELRDGRAYGRRVPPRIDCSYLITAWSSAPRPVEDEHRLLGEVMKVLLRHRQLPADVLQGELVGQAPPVRARVLRDGHLQSLGEFWQAMGGKPKASLHYTVTVNADIYGETDLGVPTTEQVLNLNRGVDDQNGSTTSPGG